MIITCWGSRGSIPISGRHCVRYGGDTTCLEIQTLSGDILVVDAGTGIRALGNHLLTQDRRSYHFLLTHAHWDHIQGFPFFRPILYPDVEVFLHSGPFHPKYVAKMLARVMSPPNFPLRYADISATLHAVTDPKGAFTIGSLRVETIPLSHPNTGAGYKFIENGRVFVFLTDNELGLVHPGGRPFDDYVHFCRDADLLIHDGEYSPEEYRNQRGWGHSSFTDALRLAGAAGVRQLGLFHLNQERSDDQMDAIVDRCRQMLQSQGQAIDCVAVGTGRRFDL